MSFFRSKPKPQPGGGGGPVPVPTGPVPTGPTPPHNVPNPMGTAGATTAPCTRFAGVVTQITTIANAVPVTLARAAISGPWWDFGLQTAAMRLPAHHSPKPAAVPTGAGSDLEMTVVITVAVANGLSGQARLRGRIAGGPYWEGDFPAAAGSHNVTVRLPASTTLLEAHRGDIAWEAVVPGCGTHPVGRSRVEIYRIKENTTPVYLTAGRPAEGLRFIYDNMGVSGTDVGAGVPAGALNATGRITSYLHHGHGLFYDTVQGGAHYLTWGASMSFRLTDYIVKASGDKVNCYDQASAVLVCAGLIGIRGHKRYVEPFGFITPTALVGNVMCNNPFYSSNGTTAMVPRLHPDRTSFGNHEFYMDTDSAKVFDACAGPHLGTEDYRPYLEASVDLMMMSPGVEDPRMPDWWRRNWTYTDDRFRIDSIS